MPKLGRSSGTKVPQLASPLPLPPCPRPAAVAGKHDWYTIKDIPEIDICPSCMSNIGNSPYRAFFIPSLSKPLNPPVRCALSQPWIRLAWTQLLQQHRRNLDLLKELIHLPPDTRSCPGKKGEERSWYRLIDPEVGSHVPNFEACSACVRAVELIFPQIKGIFKRNRIPQLRTCDLTCESRRFNGYMAHLEAAAKRYDIERLREPDIRNFVDHARRTARVRECLRDDRILSQPWHFIPQLPEFTVCEECFQSVVWPVIDKPIARNFNRTLQFVPGTTEDQPTDGISCQLYSDRMRRLFMEAVQYNDFDLLRSAAVRRHGVENLVQERHILLMRDMEMGVDRSVEMMENVRHWKQME